MDTLNLRTELVDAANARFSWQWHQAHASQPVAGELLIRLDPAHEQDGATLAELFGIHHLLEVRKIHGQNRCGNGIRIQLSAGEIRKALLKGSLKSSGVGATKKAHVAAAAEFLATKYFEASFEIGKWRDAEPKSFESAQLELGAAFPRLRLECPLLGTSVAVSRHAMHRYVGRIDQRLDIHAENDLSAVPDSRWTAAWRWMDRVLRNPNLAVATVRPEAQARLQAKYGEGAHYLRHPDTQSILVFRTDAQGLTLATVLRDNAYAGFIEKDAYVVGQRLVRGHVHELAKAGRPGKD